MKQSKNAAVRHPFSAETGKGEAVEIRLSPSGYHELVILIAVALDNGAVQASMSSLGVGSPLSLSNLQMSLPLPRKAVQGWQIELVEAVASGLYSIVEVR
jgi:hypothetical protein